MWKVQWSADGQREISSLSELDSLLDELHAKYQGDRAIIVTIEAPGDGGTLAIGVGRELSVLNYVPASGNPPYLSSVGDLTGDETIIFHFMGQWSEFPIRHAISFESAREAVRYFFKTQRLPDSIIWEKD
jgi:hypothetical protein